MKYLIVNADDFGASGGINRGIMEAHRSGIVTSASLLVTSRWSEEAAGLSREAPRLSVGLHLDLGREWNEAAEPGRLQDTLGAQFARFGELMGRSPTHLDSHHHAHRDVSVLPYFIALARAHGLPLREHSPVCYLPQFYGQWGGETHPEQISPQGLARMLETQIGEGVTELSCHPGYVDRDFTTSYLTERELELQTLCHPRLRPMLAALSIQLVSYHELDEVVAGAVA